MNEELQGKLAKALQMQGNLYDLQDILTQIENGDMQSFANGDSWVITSVTEYPKRRVLDILLIVGDLEDSLALQEQVVNFAKDVGCTLVRADGRDGWTGHALKTGWRKVATTFYKDI